MEDLRERYDLSHMRVRPRHQDYRTFYLGDLAARMMRTPHQTAEGVVGPIQTEYDGLAEEDKTLVDKYLNTHKED